MTRRILLASAVAAPLAGVAGALPATAPLTRSRRGYLLTSLAIWYRAPLGGTMTVMRRNGEPFIECDLERGQAVYNIDLFLPDKFRVGVRAFPGLGGLSVYAFYAAKSDGSIARTSVHRFSPQLLVSFPTPPGS